MKKKPLPKMPFNSYWPEALLLCFLILAVSCAVQWNGSHRKPAPKGTQVTLKKEPAKAQPRVRKERKAPEVSSSAVSLSSEEYLVLRVFDGDTVELKDGQNRQKRIRLYGIDAPEGKQAYGQESRSHATQLLKGKKVRLKKMYDDDYGRTVAIVYLSSGGKEDALSINERQIQSGMAWVYDFFCKSEECNTWKVEEAMARNKKIGLWSNPGAMPPWQWRAIQKH